MAVKLVDSVKTSREHSIKANDNCTLYKNKALMSALQSKNQKMLNLVNAIICCCNDYNMNS